MGFTAGAARPAAAQDTATPTGVHPRLVVRFTTSDRADTVREMARTPRAFTARALAELVPAAASAQRPIIVEYSDAYRTRARIHRIASMAALPLFAAEALVGQSLYSNPSRGKRGAHLALATGIGALFAVNSVTGVWNMMEARKDPNQRKRRWLHGLLMLAADAGFLTTAALAPDDDFGEHGTRARTGGGRGAHRAAAMTSLGLATAGYLVMLFGGD